MDEGDSNSTPPKLNKKLKVFFRKHSFYFSLILIIFFSSSLVYVSGKKITASHSRIFSSSGAKKENLNYSNNVFIGPIKNFMGEYPGLVFIHKDALVGISSPAIITSKVLGSITGNRADIERDEIIEYNVEEGDTIGSIAKKFNLSVQTILWANNLSKNSALKIGQELTILPVDGIIHIVKKGETISEIAQKYKASLDKIISFNKISSSDEIFEHQPLIIPGEKLPAVIYHHYAKAQSSSITSSNTLSTHDFYGLSHHYPWGQCTYWVAQRRAIPGWGNARDWLNNAIASGYSVCKGSYCKPEVGAVVSLKGSYLGHVAYVERVEGNKIIFSEMNYIGLGKMDYRSMRIGDPRIFGYIYKP